MRWAWLGLLCLGCACGDDDGPIEPTYANVERVVERSCAVSSTCHAGSGRGRGRLNFETPIDDGRPITDILVGIDACQYDVMDRVVPFDPDQSWLIVKLEQHFDSAGYIEFEPDPMWDPGITRRMTGGYPPSECPLVVRRDGVGELSFGRIMPSNPGRPARLPANERTMFREWVAMGAPGPDGMPTIPIDGGMRDAGRPRDSGLRDSGLRDTGPADDSGPDLDSGSEDGGPIDSGAADTGPADSDSGPEVDSGA